MSSSSAEFKTLLAGPAPVLTLAPMQEVTDLAFWTLIHEYGGEEEWAKLEFPREQWSFKRKVGCDACGGSGTSLAKQSRSSATSRSACSSTSLARASTSLSPSSA